MAGFIGRTIALTWGGSPILGVREKGVSLNGEPVDQTSSEDAGWRTLLDDMGERAVEISLSGVTKDQILKDDWFNGDRTQTMTLTYDDTGIVSGSFMLVNYSETGPYKDATTFEATFQSMGVVTYVP